MLLKFILKIFHKFNDSSHCLMAIEILMWKSLVTCTKYPIFLPFAIILMWMHRLMKSPRCKIAIYSNSYPGNFQEVNPLVAASPRGFRWRLVGVSQSVITIRTHPLRALRVRAWVYVAYRVPPLGTSKCLVCDHAGSARARAAGRPGTLR